MSAMQTTLAFTWIATNSARKVGNNIYLYLKHKLKLPINREKSGIRKPTNFNDTWDTVSCPNTIRGKEANSFW